MASKIVKAFSENVSAVKTRPDFDKMIATAHRGKFDVLLGAQGVSKLRDPFNVGELLEAVGRSIRSVTSTGILPFGRKNPRGRWTVIVRPERLRESEHAPGQSLTRSTR